MVSRRIFLTGGTALVGGAFLTRFLGGHDDQGPQGTYPVAYTEKEWRDRLTPEQFDVLRKDGTEAPYTSPLNDEHRTGTFSCVGCDQHLFSSKTKFNSGTGWPSFYDHLPNAIGTRKDGSLVFARTEVHCARCGGHLGHVFNDGPKPTGLRYCIDGVAMTFAEGAA